MMPRRRNHRRLEQYQQRPRRRTDPRQCSVEGLEDRRLLTSSPGLPWLETADISTLGDFETGDNAGFQVAIDGDTLVVSSDRDDDAGLDAGAAYVYVRSDGGTPNDPSDDTWTQQAKLIAQDAMAQDGFGRSVDIQNDTIVVGAYHQDNAGNGAAYVFSRAGATWNEIAKLTASDEATGDRFGGRVAIDGDTIVVGAQSDNETGSGSGMDGSGSGAAYLFVEPSGGWSGILTETVKLTASDLGAGYRFGRNVDVLGDTVLVSADQRDVGDGAAYMFYRDDHGTPNDSSDDIWTEAAILQASDHALGDQFGNVVALDGDRAVITAHRDDHSGVVDAGSAYVFERNDNGTPGDRSDDTWDEAAKLVASDANTSDEFGRGGDIDGDTIVIGAWSAEIEVADSGSVYVFERQSDGSWVEQGEVSANDAKSAAENFGAGRITIQGDTLVVGDYAHKTDGNSISSNRGGAFVFSKTSSSIIASDLFESGSFTGGLGQWSTDGGWAAGGFAEIVADGGAHSGAYHALLRSGSGELQRTVDVSGAANVRLQFWSEASSFEKSDRAYVQVSGDGSNWTTLATISSADSDGQYHRYALDVPDLGPTFHIRFDAAMNGATDYWYIDNVEVIAAPPGPPQITISDATAIEGGNVSFTISLSSPSSQPVSVDFATSDDLATAGDDYAAATGTLDFEPGVTAQTVIVSTFDDVREEGSETFALNLFSASGAVILDAQGVATIQDNDGVQIDPNALYVYDISFESRKHGNEWRAVFEVRRDSNMDGAKSLTDDVVANVSITLEFAGVTYSGTTDVNGIFRSGWLRLDSGQDYYANAVDLAFSGYTWDPFSIDGEEDDSDGDGNPDDVLHRV